MRGTWVRRASIWKPRCGSLPGRAPSPTPRGGGERRGVAQARAGALAGGHENMRRAIERDPHTRIIARHDADLAALAGQPPFDALLYPEKKVWSSDRSKGRAGRPPTGETIIVPMEDASPLRVVAIGGGHGLAALLEGLKGYAKTSEGAPPAVDLTAIVTVTDDGGSSGRLRREFDVLPPGDIRNCLVALSEDAALLARLFQYRFQTGRGLKGHSFGNLFLAALTQVMGNFPDDVKVSAEVLKIAGRIYPATAANVALEATLANGAKIVGEPRISRSRQRIRRIRLIPRHAPPLPATLAAIEEADVITLGPGSLFTSIVPNLLVDGIAAAIRGSSAVKAYFVNLMWQPGETMEFRASDHIRAVHRHAGGKFLDYAVVNLRPILPAMKKRYARQAALPVENDVDAIFKMGLKVMAGNLAQHTDKVRHDPAITLS